MTEFKLGQILAVNWESDGIFCGGYTESTPVVFIKDFEGDAQVAYAYEHDGVCVGYVPYSALSES